MAFNLFPYTNLHNLNLDWILNVVKTMAAAVETAAGTVEAYAARLQAVENSRVSYTERQQLSAQQQTTARGNIGAAPSIGVVRYNEEQALSESYKAQARSNIGALGSGDIPPAANAVLYTEQNLTELQKAQARSNIEAAATSAIPDVSDVVRYSAQARTPEQQLRARTNIGAAYSGDVTDLADRVSDVEDVTALAITSTAQTLTDAQKTQARSNIGAGSAVDVQDNANEIQTIYGELNNLYLFVNTISGTTPTITPANNNIYNCGEVTSLTISNAPATGAYSIVFTSGATATTTTIPATILGLETFAAEANTIYEINVMDNRAVVGSWEVSA